MAPVVTRYDEQLASIQFHLGVAPNAWLVTNAMPISRRRDFTSQLLPRDVHVREAQLFPKCYERQHWRYHIVLNQVAAKPPEALRSRYFHIKVSLGGL